MKNVLSTKIIKEGKFLVLTRPGRGNKNENFGTTNNFITFNSSKKDQYCSQLFHSFN